MTDSRLLPWIPLARASKVKYPTSAPVSISLAQTIVESAWGARPAGQNNLWGMKANDQQLKLGQFVSVWTLEVINGVSRRMVQNFATFPSLADGFDAHAHLLTMPWYSEWRTGRGTSSIGRSRIPSQPFQEW